MGYAKWFLYKWEGLTWSMQNVYKWKGLNVGYAKWFLYEWEGFYVGYAKWFLYYGREFHKNIHKSQNFYISLLSLANT